MNPELRNRQTELQEIFHGAPISKAYGMSMSYDESGSAIFSLPYNPNLNHGLGGIHGGVLATLLDNAGWFTIAPYFNNWITTVDLHVQYLQHAQQMDLVSKGTLVRLGKTLSVARMEVITTDNKLIAIGSGTFATTSVPFHS